MAEAEEEIEVTEMRTEVVEVGITKVDLSNKKANQHGEFKILNKKVNLHGVRLMINQATQSLQVKVVGVIPT
jgi:hypothetical protein